MVDFQKQVIEYYLKNGSIKHTAVMFEVSDQLVRRYLINAGLYSTPRIKEVTGLYNKGLTADQISNKLHITRKTVISMLPYRKGTYKAPPSPGALRVRKCLARKKAMAASADAV